MIQRPPSRLEALDGLRAIAIGLVLLNHFTPGRNSNQGMGGLIFKVADIGWAGVDLFFVLSGFLITRILLNARATDQPIRHFFIRRALRIVPAYFLVLALVFFVPAMVGLHPVPSLSTQIPYWFYYSNYDAASYELLFGSFGMSHFWSLAVEMQFYLAWPLIIYNCNTQTVGRIAVIALLCAPAARGVAASLDTHWTVYFGWTLLRMDGLLVGSLVALAMYRGVTFERVKLFAWSLVWVGAAFIGWVIWTDRAFAMFKGLDYPLHVQLTVLIPTIVSLFCGAVLWIGLQRNTLGKVLAHPVFRPLATYSYGTYLVHYVLMPTFEKTFGPQVMQVWIGGGDFAVYMYFLLASGCSVVIASAMYHLVESRFLALKSQVRLRPSPAKL
jgi:peptidoglycan/LPS O-acetylase OafA/YrhL